jgi:hypothetical protein
MREVISSIVGVLMELMSLTLFRRADGLYPELPHRVVQPAVPRHLPHHVQRHPRVTGICILSPKYEKH